VPDRLAGADNVSIPIMAKIEHDWIYIDLRSDSQATLTKRQQLVLQRIANGQRADEIAYELGCSVAMVRKHETAIRIRLGAKTNAHAIYLYF